MDKVVGHRGARVHPRRARSPTTSARGSSPCARRASCRGRRRAQEYALEYGTATLEIHRDAVAAGRAGADRGRRARDRRDRGRRRRRWWSGSAARSCGIAALIELGFLRAASKLARPRPLHADPSTEPRVAWPRDPWYTARRPPVDSREEVQRERPPRRSRCRLAGRPETAPSRSRACSRRCARYNPKADLKDLERAYRFAEAAHEGQKRLSGEDFIEHPLAVATILADLGLDTTTLRRRCSTTRSRTPRSRSRTSRQEFGDEVARIVDGLTKLERSGSGRASSQQAENVRKMIVAMARDIRVLLIKLADRLHNMRTLARARPRRSSSRSRPRPSRSTRRSRTAWACTDQVGARGPRRSRRCTRDGSRRSRASWRGAAASARSCVDR